MLLQYESVEAFSAMQCSARLAWSINKVFSDTKSILDGPNSEPT